MGNFKIIPDIITIFQNEYLLYRIEIDIKLAKFSQIRISGKIDTIKTEINDHSGTVVQIKQFINDEKITGLRDIE